MKRTAAAIALALAACGSAPPVPAPSPSPRATPALPMADRIGMTRDGPWGADWHEWLIDSSGAVRMRTQLRDGSRAVRFTMTPTEFIAIRDRLGALERRQGKFLEGACITDQGGAAITWHYGRRKVDLLVDNGCSGGIYASAFATLDAIRQKLDTLSEAAPDRKVTISAH